MGTIITITVHKNLLSRFTFELRKMLTKANATNNTQTIKKINPNVPLMAEVKIYMGYGLIYLNCKLFTNLLPPHSIVQTFL